MGHHGFGPNDIVVPRPALAGRWFFALLTYLIVAASMLAVALLARALLDRNRKRADAVLLVVVLLLMQMAGAVLTSFNFRNNTVGPYNAPSLDRYLLPVLPFLIVLILWALTRGPHRLSVAWVSVFVLGALTVVGTRDNLVYHHAIWDLATFANAQGIENDRLDAGYSWNAYHLWQPTGGQPIQPATPNPPWWIAQFSPTTDSTFVVAGGVLDGYTVIEERPYSSWLHDESTALYLLQRPPGQ